jgi:hypothetical protein
MQTTKPAHLRLLLALWHQCLKPPLEFGARHHTEGKRFQMIECEHLHENFVCCCLESLAFASKQIDRNKFDVIR